MARKVKLKIVDRHFEDMSQYNQPAKEKVPQGIQSNRLKIKIEDLKTFKPLTKNQKLFFDCYSHGDEAIMMYGSAGTGKCQGEDVEVNLLVSDEIYEKLKNL